jgi:hypothetical protein
MPTTVERETLYQLIDNLPDDRIVAAIGLIRNLQDEDDESLSEEELAAIARSDEDIAAGRFYTLEEFNQRMNALL